VAEVSARIIIQIDLDDAAYAWELTGEGEAPDDRWDSKPIDILKDAVKYASGWRINTSTIPGEVTYKGQLIEIDGARASSITWDYDEEE
jgi:hypothetical protein